MGFWSLPNSITQDNLEKLENGMLDISDVGKTWQFKLSHEYVNTSFECDCISKLIGDAVFE